MPCLKTRLYTLKRQLCALFALHVLLDALLYVH
jgi:hypothetical protein